MNLNAITIQDCEEMKKYKNMSVVINDGEIISFEYEKSTVDYQSEQC